MGRFCIKAAECTYKEYDGWVKEQFINGINNEEITHIIIKGLTA